MSDAPGPKCPVCCGQQTQLLRPYRATLPGNQAIFAGLSIYQCRDCTGQFAHPVPAPDILDRYYQNDYRSEGTLHRHENTVDPWEGLAVRARSQCDLVLQPGFSPMSWLDIGAGYGLLLDETRRRGIPRTGAVEPDAHSRARLRKNGHTLFTTQAELTDSWDVISISHVLEHVAEPVTFLTQLRSHLSEQGCLFCEVPNDCRLQAAANDAPHLVFYTMSALQTVFERAGYGLSALKSCGKRLEATASGRLSRWGRRLGRKIFTVPPPVLDQAIHPHFHHSAQDDRQWLRCLAAPAANVPETNKTGVAGPRLR